MSKMKLGVVSVQLSLSEQIWVQENISNRERLIDWIHSNQINGLPDWCRSLIELEPIEQFDRTERIWSIFSCISQFIVTPIRDISIEDLVLPEVIKSISGKFSKKTIIAVYEAIRLSGLPGCSNVSENFKATIKAEKIGYDIELPAIFDRFLSYVAAKGHVKGTICEYRRSLRHFVLWLEVHGLNTNAKLFRELSQEHVAGFLRHLNKMVHSEKLSQQAASLIGTRILVMLGFYSNRIGIPNYGKGLKPIDQKTKFDRWIPTEEHCEAFFESILDYSLHPLRDFVMFGLMYSLGLRPNETRDIRKEDFRMDLQQLRFQQKGGEIAIITLPDSFVPWCKEFLPHVPDGNFVFREKNGKITQDLRSLLFHMYSKIAKWPVETGPSVFRHAFCTHLHHSGVSYANIQRLARHKDIRTTVSYIHLNNMDLKLASQNTANYLSKEVDLYAYSTK